MITDPRKQNRAGGFTLIELLTVMAIMLVIMGLVIVAFPNIGKAGNLTNGTQSFADILTLARQTALAQNRTVEVRFYYLPGPTDGTTCTAYRAMRMIVCDTNGYSSDPADNTRIALGAQPGIVKRLPSGIIIHSDSTGKFTTLLPAMSNTTNPVPTWPAVITTASKPSTGTETFPGETTTTSYASFQFRPNGTTNLDPVGTTVDKWFMSFKIETDPVQGTVKPSNNFITLLIDPTTGRTKSYRPGN